eukprot:symbB.v1.2.037025.t2/scaffold5360.1/size28108/2
MDDFQEDFGDDEGIIQSVIIGLVHLGTIVIICRSCCCGSSGPRAAGDGRILEVQQSALQPQKRLFTRLVAAWTMNFAGLGWLLDGALMPCYVRSFNSLRCVPGVSYDNSRKRLLCHLPMFMVGALAFLLGAVVYLPTLLHTFQVVDIDRIAAQTQAPSHCESLRPAGHRQKCKRQ